MDIMRDEILLHPLNQIEIGFTGLRIESNEYFQNVESIHVLIFVIQFVQGLKSKPNPVDSRQQTNTSENISNNRIVAW